MKIEICMSSRCVMLGAEEILTRVEETKELILNMHEDVTDEDIEIVTTTKNMHCEDCLDMEGNEPLVFIDGEVYRKANAKEIMNVMLTAYPVEEGVY